MGTQYNGQTINLLHCINGSLEVLPAVVKNGRSCFIVTSLSPFAVVRSLASITVTPKTGSAAVPQGFIIIGIAGLLCAGCLTIKRREL